LIKLTNRTGGEWVDTLKSGATIRLKNKESKTVNDTEVTKHIENLIKKGLVFSETVQTETKKTVANKKSGDKEVKEE